MVTCGTKMVAAQGGEKDIFRDTWVRYLGMESSLTTTALDGRFQFRTLPSLPDLKDIASAFVAQ